ncbi:MAG: VacJ family lipoprotein, partial [Myxococcota bacterium]
VVLAVIAMGCASTAGPPEPPEPVDADSVWDPWEGFNRGMFWFNEKADIYVLRPAAVGWDFVLPDIVQTALTDIYANARFPIVFLNDLLQGKWVQASQDLGRFALNTTLGLGGSLDPAKEAGWEAHNEDFGQTLGYWGVPPGPYLVIPFLGPSNARDTLGRAADSATLVYPYFVVWYINAAITAPNVLNTRAQFIEEIDDDRRTALDFYAFQRNAYMDYRKNLVNDSEEDEEETGGEALYFFDEDE